MKKQDYQPRILSLVKLPFKDKSKINHFHWMKTYDLSLACQYNSQVFLSSREMTCYANLQGMKSLRNGEYSGNIKDYIYIFLYIVLL